MFRVQKLSCIFSAKWYKGTLIYAALLFKHISLFIVAETNINIVQRDLKALTAISVKFTDYLSKKKFQIWFRLTKTSLIQSLST